MDDRGPPGSASEADGRTGARPSGRESPNPAGPGPGPSDQVPPVRRRLAMRKRADQVADCGLAQQVRLTRCPGSPNACAVEARQRSRIRSQPAPTRSGAEKGPRGLLRADRTRPADRATGDDSTLMLQAEGWGTSDRRERATVLSALQRAIDCLISTAARTGGRGGFALTLQMPARRASPAPPMRRGPRRSTARRGSAAAAGPAGGGRG